MQKMTVCCCLSFHSTWMFHSSSFFAGQFSAVVPLYAHSEHTPPIHHGIPDCEAVSQGGHQERNDLPQQHGESA